VRQTTIYVQDQQSNSLRSAYIHAAARRAARIVGKPENWCKAKRQAAQIASELLQLWKIISPLKLDFLSKRLLPTMGHERRQNSLPP
jgi:hypothetical protein